MMELFHEFIYDIWQMTFNISWRAGRPGFNSQQGPAFFSPRYRFQTGSGVHPPSYPMGNGGSYPGGKAAGAWNCPLTTI